MFFLSPGWLKLFHCAWATQHQDQTLWEVALYPKEPWMGSAGQPRSDLGLVTPCVWPCENFFTYLNFCFPVSKKGLENQMIAKVLCFNVSFFKIRIFSCTPQHTDLSSLTRDQKPCTLQKKAQRLTPWATGRRLVFLNESTPVRESRPSLSIEKVVWT